VNAAVHQGFVPTAAHVIAARRELARRHLIDFAGYLVPDYQRAGHHEMICDRLEAVERGEIDRLMITMPPRHGKSQLGSRLFPAWCLGRNPRTQIIAASYNSDLASDFGRDVRNIVGGQEFGEVFPGVTLSADSKAANRMNTNRGGAYIAAGVGTAVTGRGARIAIIDDPFKDREEADSQRNRDKVWAWYQSTLYTRLMPGGAIVCINCMTGDTPVLMADGAEKRLDAIKVGDMVSSYDGDGVKPQKVLNWANQGSDDIFAITMKSGRVIRANERHPFLVLKDGAEVWTRVRKLNIGDKLLGLKDIGASGAESLVPLMVATSQQNAKGFVARIIASKTGLLVDIAERTINSAKRILNTAMVWTWLPTTHCLSSRVESVPFARAVVAEGATPQNGAATYRSIIATKLERFAGFSATTAILPWVTQRQKPSPELAPTICAIVPDEIVSIEADGVADVFDIEVEHTANFVANGLFSHNTRWNEDDLSGRLLNGADKWELLELPAINAAGEALWPEWYDLDALERIKANIGPREWSALYQQKPQPDEGTFFQRDWLKHWEQKPNALNVYGTSDYAVTDGGGDYTVHRIWGIDQNGDAYRLDGWRGQATADVWIDRKIDLIARWKPLAWFGEAGVIQKAVEPMLRRRMQERKTFCRLEWMPSIADKPTRARGFQARAAMGKVWFEPGADVSEFLMFPAGKHDDDVDCGSLIGRALDETHPAIVRNVVSPSDPVDRYRRARSPDMEGSAFG
jgi:predicted phage terminase large subunit-like protein